MKRFLHRLSRVTAFYFLVSRLHPSQKEVDITPDERAELEAILGDAYTENGIDYDRLKQKTKIVDLDRWERETTDSGSPVVSPRHP
jgi:hypothetical protein